MLVQNNFVYNKDFINIYSQITNINFPWYMDKDLNSFKLFHDLVENVNNERVSSPYSSSILTPLLIKLKPKNVLSARLDCYLKTDKIIQYELKKPSKITNQTFTAMLFMNTNNSYIQVIGGDKIKAKENKFICFKKDIALFETSHTDVDKKIVLSLEYSI